MTNIVINVPAGEINLSAYMFHAHAVDYFEYSKVNTRTSFLLSRMPSVPWKLMNIQKLLKQNPDKHEEQVKALEDRLAK